MILSSDLRFDLHIRRSYIDGTVINVRAHYVSAEELWGTGQNIGSNHDYV